MRRNRFESVKIVVVLAVVAPGVALAHVHGGNSNLIVEPLSVPPGGTIDVSFDYTITHDDTPPHGEVQCQWEVWLDDQPTNYTRSGVALLASGSEPHPADGSELTFHIDALGLEMPDTPEVYYIKIVTSSDGWWSSSYWSWYESGKPPVGVAVTVEQQDTTPPEITLNGPATLTLECGVDSYTELGATAWDDVDPEVTVVIGGDTVDTGTCGTYVVTYDATDSSGNAAAQVTRTVTVQDTTDPVINCPGDMKVYVSPGETGAVVEFEVTATDAGGSVAVVCNPESGSTFPLGTTTVTCTATDAAGNVATCTFAVAVKGPVQLVEDLAIDVYALNLHQGIENSLDAKLDAAMNAIDDLNENNDVAAINSLEAFVNAVEAQRENKITNEQADTLIFDAEQIIALLLAG